MRRVLLILGLSVTACGTEAGPSDVVDSSSGSISHDFPIMKVASGEERNFICQSWTLDNDEPLYVNAVSMEGGPGWHHSNWLYAPEGDFAGPDGTWPCAERGFDLVTAGIRGGVFYTQSPEAKAETERFRDGVAIVIPPHSKVILELHLLNVSEQELSTHAHLRLDTLARENVQVELAPLALSYYPLALPPQARSTFTADCDLATIMGGPLDFRIYYVAPHYHALGTGMKVEAYDADGSSVVIADANRPIGEPLGVSFAEPFDVTGAQGIRFGCRYDNPGTETVRFGAGQADEMCVMFAFTDSRFRWVGGVPDGSESVSLGRDASDMRRFSGSCSVLALNR